MSFSKINFFNFFYTLRKYKSYSKYFNATLKIEKFKIYSLENKRMPKYFHMVYIVHFVIHIRDTQIHGPSHKDSEPLFGIFKAKNYSFWEFMRFGHCLVLLNWNGPNGFNTKSQELEFLVENLMKTTLSLQILSSNNAKSRKYIRITHGKDYWS